MTGDFPYHLLHPALVHFAVAFLAAGAGAEGWGILARREAVERFGSVLVPVGTLLLLPTVATGWLAANTVDLPPGASADLARHETFGLATAVWFLGLLFWRGWEGGTIGGSRRVAYALLVLAGAVLVTATAFLGGELVYGHAVGVGGLP